MKRLLVFVAAVSALFIGALIEQPVSDTKKKLDAPVFSAQPLSSMTSSNSARRFLRVSNGLVEEFHLAQPVSVLAPVTARSARLPTPVLGPVSGSLDAASRAAAWANLEVGDGTEPFQAEFAAAVPDGSRWIWQARVGYGRGDLTVTVRLDSLGNPDVNLLRWLSVDEMAPSVIKRSSPP